MSRRIVVVLKDNADALTSAATYVASGADENAIVAALDAASLALAVEAEERITLTPPGGTAAGDVLDVAVITWTFSDGSTWSVRIPGQPDEDAPAVQTLETLLTDDGETDQGLALSTAVSSARSVERSSSGADRIRAAGGAGQTAVSEVGFHASHGMEVAS